MTQATLRSSGDAAAGAALVKQLVSKKLSTLRTENEFLHYAEFASTSEYQDLLAYARKNDLPVLILGNGSNTFFSTRKIRTLVLKNKMPKVIEPLGDGRFSLSATVQVSTALKKCLAEGLDSFYYLASVPAQIGGALAMNAGAGKGHERTIYDFAEDVTYLEDGEERVVSAADAVVGFRKSIFTGLTDKLILRATFRFPPRPEQEGDPIAERVAWCRDNQEPTLPNCGSVYRVFTGKIAALLHGVRIGKAHFSRRTRNWIVNEGEDPKDVRRLVKLGKLVHRLLLRPVKMEWIVVD